MNKILQIN